MKKTWKRIPNYRGYLASSEGEILTFNWKGSGQRRVMKPALDNCGYMRTMLKRNDGITHTIKVHRIIASAFIPNPENLPQVNHLNGIRNDNRVKNLEWCTASQNAKHSYFLKRSSQIGEKNPASILTEKDVLEIRANYVYGRKSRHEAGETKTQIAKRYGCTVHAIKRVIQGTTWRHLL